MTLHTSIVKVEEGKMVEKDVDRSFQCYENADFSFLVNILSMSVNFGYYSYLSNVPFATDQRWAQYMMMLGLNIVVQLSGAIAAGSLII